MPSFGDHWKWPKNGETTMKLAFEPIWPWYLVFAVLAAMLAVIWLGYPRRIRHLPKFWQRTLIGLRVAMALLLLLWIVRPLLVYESDDSSNAVVYVVIDGSRSMETPDATGGSTRRKAMLSLLENARPYLDDLGDSVEVRYRELSESLVPFDQPSEIADGGITAIGANLETLAKEPVAEKIAAILFFSDGKQAANGKLDIDAVQAAKLLGRNHRPVYTVPFGSTEIADTTLDVSLSELDVARDAFIRNVVPIRVRFRALGAAGRDVKIQVSVEQRAGVPNGSPGVMQLVPHDGRDNISMLVRRPDENAEDMTLDFRFVPQEQGEIKISVEAIPLDDEVRRTNNKVETIIRVQSGGIRVVYFDNPRFEYRFLKRITDSSRVQLDAQPVWQGKFSERNEFDESWFEPGNYDAFIIGDVPAEYFGPERLAKIVKCCEQGAGLMMIGGQNNFTDSGYARNRNFAELLPVVVSVNNKQLEGDIQMIPRRAGKLKSILQIAPPDQNDRRWSELPPLKGANLLRVREGLAAEVLAESQAGDPLLIQHRVGASRILAFAGDTTWQWAMDEDWAAEAHKRFWRQAIFWLTKMENDGKSPLWVTVEPRSLAPGRTAELAFGLRDENGLPLSGVNYGVNVQDPDGQIEELSARQEDSYGASSYQNTLLPGDYWVNVAVPASATQGPLFSSTRFLVDARDPELDNPAADPALMRELAHASGGDFLTPASLLERLEDWSENGLPSLEIKRSRRLSLWDNWPSLLSFVILATTEWWLRKKRGLV